MPTYTYRCQKCGEEFERFQSMSDEPVKRCPSCKGKVQRTFHPVGIVLKGSGFHRNDYRSPSKGRSGESSSSESGSGSSSEQKSGSKSESKSDKTSDAKPSGKGSDGKGSSTSGSSKD